MVKMLEINFQYKLSPQSTVCNEKKILIHTYYVNSISIKVLTVLIRCTSTTLRSNLH